MKFALIGRKLSHSYSCEIHKLMGLNYSLKEIEPDKLKEFVNGNDLNGFNVTIPYKKQIIPLLDEISPEAKRIGSVNTVLIKNGKKIGYNTDVFGMQYLFDKNGIDLKNKSVAILGSGGTKETAEYLCKKNGAKSVRYIGRTSDIDYDNCYYNLPDTEIIINATPVGMYPKTDDCLIEAEKFKNLKFVCDCVYNPLSTKLIYNCKKRGIRCDNGLKMLVMQALFSEKIWLNDDSVLEKAEYVYNMIKKQKSNVVLFGMPSCGKTSVGKELAKILNKEFIDTDSLIEKELSVSPSKIITEQGEWAFREIESKIIKDVSNKTGVVISVGGGAVLREENVFNLQLNGKLFYIVRDLSLLKTDNRPISEKTGVKKLYEQRKNIYNSIKDFEVENNGKISDCVKKVVEIYESSCN